VDRSQPVRKQRATQNLRRAAAFGLLSLAAIFAAVFLVQAAAGVCTAPGAHAAGVLRSTDGTSVGEVFVNGELNCVADGAARSITIEIYMQRPSVVAAIHLHDRGSDRAVVDLGSVGKWIEPSRFRAVLRDSTPMTTTVSELRRAICANETYADVHLGDGPEGSLRAQIDHGTKC
jgi:hypothetical protein